MGCSAWCAAAGGAEERRRRSERGVPLTPPEWEPASGGNRLELLSTQGAEKVPKKKFRMAMEWPCVGGFGLGARLPDHHPLDRMERPLESTDRTLRSDHQEPIGVLDLKCVRTGTFRLMSWWREERSQPLE